MLLRPHHPRTSPCRHRARHVDTRLITSTRGSPRRRRARDLNAGLANSTCASPPYQCAPYLLDAGLAVSTRASPPRHLNTRIPTCTRTSLMYLRLDGARHVNLRLPKSACASPPRRGAQLDAELGISTPGSPFRRHFDVGLNLRCATSKPHRHGTRDLDPHLDAGLPTLTLGSEPRHLDTGLATLTRSLLLHVLRAEHNVLLV
ncbi:hypothetical protein K438DRAFT_1970305 [Mycena galopus ATCC 62051]|nr:hypothetical protein K438DRAFT_1970304 [Mycena galopus ATCC 62051]KAF8191938.1 hypothetical protein K438DRAFT_1970305 [Mycena galopus ATCC 62051]